MRGRLKPHQVLKEDTWILMFFFVIFLAFAQTTEHELLYSCRPGYAVYVWIFCFFLALLKGGVPHSERVLGRDAGDLCFSPLVGQTSP